MDTIASAEVFREYFKNEAPARMTVFTEFVGESCLCQMDGIAYKPNNKMYAL
jgi:2-iminobutanoate/2-iminopropanoate deaminase